MHGKVHLLDPMFSCILQVLSGRPLRKALKVVFVTSLMLKQARYTIKYINSFVAIQINPSALEGSIVSFS